MAALFPSLDCQMDGLLLEHLRMVVSTPASLHKARWWVVKLACTTVGLWATGRARCSSRLCWVRAYQRLSSKPVGFLVRPQTCVRHAWGSARLLHTSNALFMCLMHGYNCICSETAAFHRSSGAHPDAMAVGPPLQRVSLSCQGICLCLLLLQLPCLQLDPLCQLVTLLLGSLQC